MRRPVDLQALDRQISEVTGDLHRVSAHYLRALTRREWYERELVDPEPRLRRVPSMEREEYLRQALEEVRKTLDYDDRLLTGQENRLRDLLAMRAQRQAELGTPV